MTTGAVNVAASVTVTFDSSREPSALGVYRSSTLTAALCGVPARSKYGYAM